MEHIADFIDQHEYIFPLLCGLIIVLLIAIIVCLILINRKAKDMFDERETELLSRLRNNSQEYERSNEQTSILQEKLNNKTKECKSLKKQISDLQKELDVKNQECTQLKKEFQDFKDSKQKNWESKQASDAAKKEKQNQYIVLANDKLKYTPEQIIGYRKDVFMNEEESRKYWHICEEFRRDEYAQKYGTSQIYVFAQVALHSIFERTKTGEELDKKIEDTYTRRYFLSKSIDFLVCAAHYIKNKHYYEYKPILGIEVDGKYHENPGVSEKDEIKEQLFKAVGVPFLRFPLEENKHDKEAIRKKIRKLLLDNNEII